MSEIAIEAKVRELKLKLSNHHLVEKHFITYKFNPEIDREVVEVELHLMQLRDCEGDFTKMLRMIRQVVPVHWPVALNIRTVL